MSMTVTHLLRSLPILLLTSLPMLWVPAALRAQSIGIQNGFPAAVDPGDTAESGYLPHLPSGPAGTHGFLRNDGKGGFTFEDGEPARFFGVSFQWTACFPDSIEAIRTAARLRKLGVNLVRFEYMDNSYDWYPAASFLDQSTGYRSLNADQMRRFDWLVYQLKRRGIYSYFTLLSARAPRAEDGLGSLADSSYWLGWGMYQIYPQARAAHKLVARLLLDHVNPYTGLSYRTDPGVAFLELMDKGSILSLWRQNVTQYGGGYSWNQSRRIDTLFADYLKRNYGSTAALATAWGATPPVGGYPNLIQEGSFEGAFDTKWQIYSYNGVTTSPILNQGDTVPDGEYSLSIRVRGTSGGIFTAYMLQLVPLTYNHLYKLSFKAKCNDTNGVQLAAYGAQSSDGGLWSGLYTTFTVAPYWKSYETTFLVPVESTVPYNLAFYFGASDATITFDDVQLREVAPTGLQSGESIENATVARTLWGDALNYSLSTRRVEDQSSFFMDLEGDYLGDLYRFVKDSVGARQPLAGAGEYWAATPLEWSLERGMDFTIANSANDYVANGGGASWTIGDYSPLRTESGGPIGDLATHAQSGQPFLVSYSHPYPNRYQAESMLYLPAYAALQGYDGIIWDTYLDNTVGASAGIDSLSFNAIVKNPVMNALLPAASQILRSGGIAPALNTVGIRHSLEQTLQFPRMQWEWGNYGIPGGFNSRVPAVDRVTVDSMDAAYPTQLSDLSLPQETTGELRSDTRQIFWEYNLGSLTVNAPSVQGVTGALTRAGGIMTDLLDVDLYSGNETATILWVTLDSAKKLDQGGRSLLVVASRAERSGMAWTDSTHAGQWGSGAMVMDAVHARITFRLPTAGADVKVSPLDATGTVAGAPLTVSRSGSDYSVTIDQGTSHAFWYAVEIGNLSSVGMEAIPQAPRLERTSDPAIVAAWMPAARDRATADLFDLLGRRIARLHAGPIDAGRTLLHLDAIPGSGTYLVRLTTERGEERTLPVVVTR